MSPTGALAPEYWTPLTVSLSQQFSVSKAFTVISTGLATPMVQLSPVPYAWGKFAERTHAPPEYTSHGSPLPTVKKAHAREERNERSKAIDDRAWRRG